MSATGRDSTDAWLDLGAAETAIDPDLPIVDPHHHVWDRGGHRYLAEELRADLDSGHRFLATVYVECRNCYHEGGPEHLRAVGETRFVADTLDRPLETRLGPVAAGAGIVAFADLSRGAAVDDVLDAHAAAAQGRLRGIRYPVSWHEGEAIRSHYPTRPGMLGEAEVREGIARVGAAGLVLDVWAYFTQLSEVTAAADACPGTTFVVNHCGGPIGIGPWRGRGAEVYALWRDGIAALAQRSNVMMKLGGLGMPLPGFAFHKQPVPPSSEVLAAAWAPFVLPCIEAFGAERCLFESNWPVDRTGGRYGTVWNAFKRIVAEAGSAERAALFAGTARRIYRV